MSREDYKDAGIPHFGETVPGEPSYRMLQKRISELEQENATLQEAVEEVLQTPDHGYEKGLWIERSRFNNLRRRAGVKECRGRMKVRYIGSTDEQVKWGGNDDPRNILEEGKIYSVSKVEEHSWHTKLHLKECLGKRFNSVSFEEVEDSPPPCPRGARPDDFKHYCNCGICNMLRDSSYTNDCRGCVEHHRENKRLLEENSRLHRALHEDGCGFCAMKEEEAKQLHDIVDMKNNAIEFVLEECVDDKELCEELQHRAGMEKE